MRGDNTKPEISTPDLLLDEFLKEYYHLFVLVSVFGVLGVYLSSIKEQGVYEDDLQALLEIAVVASLTLVVIMSLYLDFIFVFIYTNELKTPAAVFSNKNILLGFFLVPFNVLILTLVVFLVRVGQTVSFVVSLVAFIGGILAYGIVSPRLFRFFKWKAESEGFGSILGVAAFGVYNVVLFAGAFLVLSAMLGQLSGVTDLFLWSSREYVTAALLYFVFGIAIMPVVMLLGLLLYFFYYRIW